MRLPEPKCNGSTRNRLSHCPMPYGRRPPKEGNTLHNGSFWEMQVPSIVDKTALPKSPAQGYRSKNSFPNNLRILFPRSIETDNLPDASYYTQYNVPGSFFPTGLHGGLAVSKFLRLSDPLLQMEHFSQPPAANTALQFPDIAPRL